MIAPCNHFGTNWANSENLSIETRTFSIETKAVSIEPDLFSVETGAVSIEPDTLSVETRAVSIEPDTFSVETRAVSIEPDTLSVETRAVAIEPGSFSVEDQAGSRQVRTHWTREKRKWYRSQTSCHDIAAAKMRKRECSNEPSRPGYDDE
jgi:hypothetical protein